VTWHLSKSEIGDADRSEAFAPDSLLPLEWRVKPTDYRNSGFDRGHLCPSKDRSDTAAHNIESFLMSNMQPQTPNLNQITWKRLEDETRRIVKRGNEAYLYAVRYGDKGRIKNKITIPTNCFKIIVVLPDGNNDLSRITNETRVIAVDMPNEETIKPTWKT
jgi:endonuclease G, mitochondrial